MLAGTTTSLPKGADGEVEMIHALRTTRHSTVKARTQAENHMKAMLVTALEVLSADLCELSTSKLVKRAACFRLSQCPMS